MRKAVDYFAGSVRVKTECRYPERIVNICAANGIDFRDYERCDDGAALMTLSISGYRTLREISQRSGFFEIKPIRRSGVPFFLWKIRKRYALLAGLVLCIMLIWASSLFVWQVDVSGNDKISDSEILASLSGLGVRVGAFRLTINQEYVSNEMLLRIPELSWLTVNIYGSRAHVIVREEVETPELRDDTPTLVFAEKSGIIEKMTVLSGAPRVTAGQTVLKGDILVDSVVGSVSSGNRLVRAEAEIWARTWYELSDRIPLKTLKKTYTGDKRTHTALIIGGKRINLYFSGGNPYAECDKITKYKPAVLPDGSLLPLTVVREEYEEYESSESELSEEEAGRILESRLLKRLSQETDDAAVKKTDISYTNENGVLTATLKAECLERIDAQRRITDEEKTVAETRRNEGEGIPQE